MVKIQRRGCFSDIVDLSDEDGTVKQMHTNPLDYGTEYVKDREDLILLRVISKFTKLIPLRGISKFTKTIPLRGISKFTKIILLRAINNIPKSYSLELLVNVPRYLMSIHVMFH